MADTPDREAARLCRPWHGHVGAAWLDGGLTAARDSGEIILDPRDYHLLCYAIRRQAGIRMKAVAILRRAFVSGPGAQPGPRRPGARLA